MSTKGDKLSEVQKRFCLEYVAGDFAGNGVQSYLKVRPEITSYDYANIKAMTLLKMPKIQNELHRLKEAAGLSEELVLKKLREGLDATARASFEGAIIESSLPDYQTRHRYAVTAAKLLKMFPAAKSDSRHLNIDVQLEKLSPEQIEKLLKSTSQPNVRRSRKNGVSKALPEKSGGADL